MAMAKSEFMALKRAEQEKELSSLGASFSAKDNELSLYSKYEKNLAGNQSVKEMAAKLNLNPENVDFGLKTKPKETEEMIKKAYDFMNKRRR